MYEYKKKDLLETLETEKNTAVPYFLLHFYKDEIKNTLDSLEGDLKPQINPDRFATQLKEKYPSIQLSDAYMNSASNLDITISYKTVKDITETCHIVIPREKLFATDSESAFKLTDKDYSDVLIECTDEFWKEHGKDTFDKSFPLNFAYNEQYRIDEWSEYQPLFSYPERVKGLKIKDWTIRMVLGVLDVYHFEPFPVKFNGNTYLLNAKIPAFNEEQARKILLKRLYDGFTLYNQDYCYHCEKYLSEKEYRERYNERRAKELEWRSRSYCNKNTDDIGEEQPLPEIGKMYECKECDFSPKRYFKDSYTASYFTNQDKFKFTAIPKLDTIKLKEVTQGATVNDFFYSFGHEYDDILAPYEILRVEGEKSDFDDFKNWWGKEPENYDCVNNKERLVASRLINLETILGYENKLLSYEHNLWCADNPKTSFVLSLAAELGLTTDSKIEWYIDRDNIYNTMDYTEKEAINQNPFMLFVLPEETRNEVLFSFVKKVEESGIGAYNSLTDLEKEFYTAQLRFARDFYRERSLFDFFAIFGDKNRPFTDSPFFQFLMDNRDVATSFGLSTQTMDTSAMMADYIRSCDFNYDHAIEDDTELDINDNALLPYIDWENVFKSGFGTYDYEKYLAYGDSFETLQMLINQERSLYLSNKTSKKEFEKKLYSMFETTTGIIEFSKKFSKKLCKKFMKYDLSRLFYAVNEYKLWGGVINPSLKDKGIRYLCKRYSDGSVSFEVGSIEYFISSMNDCFSEDTKNIKSKILLETLFQCPRK